MMGRSAKLGPFNWPHNKDWEYVHHALETVELADLASRQIGQLSGGQQQRMFIARALAQEAELMLMDEPLTGLDTPSQEGLLNLLDTLQNQNVTVMVATHDLDQAARHFDRIMLLNHRLIAFDVPQRVLHTDHLLQAYGGRLKVDSQGTMVVDDCCPPKNNFNDHRIHQNSSQSKTLAPHAHLPWRAVPGSAGVVNPKSQIECLSSSTLFNMNSCNAA